MGISALVKQISGRMGKTKQVEAFVYVVLALGSFLVVFGSSRRRFNNAFLRCVILVALVSIFTLITFISGQMVSILSEEEGLFFPIWAAYLAMFYGIPDAISAHAPGDNEQWRKYRFKFAIEAFLVISVLGLQLKYTKYSPLILALIVILMFICLWKASEWIRALEFASSGGLARATKVFADYMMQLPLEGRGYKEYLVAGPEHGDFMTFTNGGELMIDRKRNELITVQKVWDCKSGILSDARDLDLKMKDVCLSFSLCSLLCCHFAGFMLPGSSRDKQSKFLHDVVGDENYERPFRVVELELGFLYDHFYTKYSVIARRPWSKLGRFGTLVAISLAIQLLFLTPLEDPSLYAGKDDQKTKEAVFHYILVTRIIIGVAVGLETLQIFFFATSNWWKLILLCKYVEKDSWRKNALFARFLSFMGKLPRLKQWRRELGQYSFLESFSKQPFWWISNSVTSFFLENPRKGYVGNTSVALSVEVQRAVLAWMVRKGAHLTNGRGSLIENGVRNRELLSSCKFEKIMPVIMIWHIATSLCEYKQPKASSSSFVVSMTLSKYCAYLVAFGSRLLPGHSFDTDYLFRHTVVKTEQVLRGCKSMEEKIERIMRYAEIDREMKERMVVEAGGRVAKLLEEEVGDDEEKLWKILADFWTEMVLFVAPSDDPWAHAECLAQGGEFVTHLWALLFHSGIAKRECIQDMQMI